MKLGKQKGFYYWGNYYILPEGSPGVEELNASLPATVDVIHLPEFSGVDDGTYEKGVCIAPYFIADYLAEPEPLIIKDPVYPTEVELLTQQAYNDRLRARVEAFCPGCRGFGGLDENDSSLSGHFDEISLDGFCPYRWESRISPRSFAQELDDLVHAWARYGYSDYSADDVMEEIKLALKLTYTSGAMLHKGNERILALYAEKPTLISSALTDLLAHEVRTYLDPDYTIRQNNRPAADKEAALALLGGKKLGAARRECKKYGVSIAVLAYDPDGFDSVSGCLHALQEEAAVWIMYEEPGMAVLLLTGRHSLGRLRFSSPLLEAFACMATVYDASAIMRYRISFAMPCEVLEAAPEAPVKPCKVSKRALAAEEKLTLKRSEVKLLFTYVDVRLYETGCDHTLRHTETWLREHLSAEQYDRALKEIRDMGGACDCEVLMNCYADYELDKDD